MADSQSARKGFIHRIALAILLLLFAAGVAQAQQTPSPLTGKIVHVYNPFGADLPRINLSGVGHPMQPEPGNWYRFEFTSSVLQDWMVDFGIRTDNWQWLNPDGSNTEGTYDADVFGASDEIWIIVDPAQPGTPPRISVESPPTLHVFNPWPLTGPQLILGGETYSMLVDKEYCGWYRAYILDPTGTSGYFKNTADAQTYGAAGIDDTSPFDFSALFAAHGSDVWMASNTEVSGAFPDKLGSCTYLMAATVHDKALVFPDYGNTGGLGMVQSALGTDRKPLPTASAPPNFNQWFRTNPTAALPMKGDSTCLDLEMSKADDGRWEYDNQEFFAIDDFNTLDANTSCGDTASAHNYMFCLESHANFVYQKGQVFEFRGDDDVFVFINDTLALDIGGIHAPTDGKIELDTLGLVEGQTYPWDFFFCERNMCGSSLRIKTSIYFKQDRSLISRPVVLPDGSTRFDIIKRMGGTGSCGSPPGDSLVEVPTGPLTFVLYRVGGDSIGVLPKGPSYGGINVLDAAVQVDEANIVGLPAGQYRIVFYETQSPRVRDEVRFTVAARNFVDFEPPYEIAATLGDTVRVVAANRYLDSLVAEAAPWTPNLPAGLSVFSDASLTTPITGGLTTDATGFDTLWVIGNPALEAEQNYFLNVTGSDKTVKITFKLPPLDLPLVTGAEIFDDDGDGRGDRLVVTYDRDISASLPKQVSWRWPATASNPTAGTDLASRVQGGNTLVFSGSPLSEAILTAGQGQLLSTYPARQGKDSVQTLPMLDKIGPVITGAVHLLGNLSDTLRLSFSEPFSEASRQAAVTDLFAYRLGGDTLPVPLTPTGALWNLEGTGVDLLFPTGATPGPKSGDYVRLNDGPGLAADAAGNRPGPQTRFRIITGDKRTGIKTITYREIAPDAVLLAGPTFLPSLESTGATIEQVSESTGRMGHLLELDLGDFTAGDGFTPVDPAQVKLEYSVALFTNLGTPVASESRTLACTDPLFGGDCRANRGRIFIGWNYTSKAGQKIGTGAYVAIFRYQVRVQGKVEAPGELKQVWGVLRRN